MTFRVGLTHDLSLKVGKLAFGEVGQSLFDEAPGIEWRYLPAGQGELPSELVRGYDAIVLLGRRMSAATLDGNDRLALITRFGVGYDNVDVAACTERGILLTITPDAVRRAMATSNLTLLLALNHRLFDQDRLTRAGGWARKTEVMGSGLTGKTLGTIGLGNIGSELMRLVQPLGMHLISSDPYATAEHAAALSVELVDLETLLRTSDFIVICCALTPETRGLLSADRLALLKPTAYLISTARGPIVDQAALTEILRERRIAGAGIDVYEQEPVDPDDPLLKLDNVIVTPHALAWTDEWARLSGQSVLAAILDVALGNVPKYVVNREAIESRLVQAKLERYRSKGGVNAGQ